jgi:hypothetical protein
MPAMRITAWLVAASAAVLVHGASATMASPPPDIPPVNDRAREPAMTVPPADEGGGSPLDPVRVRVYRSTQIDDGALELALGVARATFAAAGIQVAWTLCEPGECGTPPSPAERLIRLVRVPRRQRHLLRCLGDALIDPQQGGGALATVYVDQVLDVARRARIDHGTLLGHTIAHEIGHLLLGSTAHGASGLMREVWSRNELRGGRGDDWALLPFEAAAIRLRLAPRRAA